LHWAALNGRKEIAELLLANKADVNAKNKYGATALLLAASTKGHKEIVEVLLAHGADANVKDKDGATPLLEAAVWGYKEIVELLLPRDRSAWPMESLQGMTSVSGVPSSVLDQIKSKAASQWPDDYEMQVYTVKKQTEAYLAIH
jgi:ankyrin repeat protein